MAREKLATAAIIVCMVAAVSTLPALLIAGSIPQPVVHNYYQTTTTNTPITNTTTNTNVTYNINGTYPIVETRAFNVSTSLYFTRTFNPLFNITMDKKTTVVKTYGRANATISGNPGSRQFQVLYYVFLNGTNMSEYSGASTIAQFSLEFGTGQWQGGGFTPEGPSFIQCADVVLQIGVACYDGYNPVSPVKLKVDVLMLYTVEL